MNSFEADVTVVEYSFQGPDYRVRRVRDRDARVGVDGGDNEDSSPSADPDAEGWKFEGIWTAPLCVFLMLVNLFVISTVFVLPILCLPRSDTENVCPIQPFSILIYVHLLHWVAHLVADQCLKAAHKRKRLQVRDGITARASDF